jgi:putative endonuclease
MIWPFRHKDKPLGQRGEDIALKHLRNRGLKILARNYRCPFGEIDLIALDSRKRVGHVGPECIVFVEVKTRTSDQYVKASAAVNEAKRRRIKKAASYYLTHRRAGEMNVRYDIISVVMSEEDGLRVEHIVGAF